MIFCLFFFVDLTVIQTCFFTVFANLNNICAFFVNAVLVTLSIATTPVRLLLAFLLIFMCVFEALSHTVNRVLCDKYT